MNEKRNLPTIQELYNDKVALSRQNDVNILLNQEPKKDWLKDHPTAKKVKYIPIERIEWLLTNIFIEWKIEILREGLMANSAYVVVRLHYKNLTTGIWEWLDGVGACPLQTDKDAAATDWTKIKNDAVMKALPAAESYAVKDAAEKLGKLFGKDLNRADQIMYDTLQGKFENHESAEELKIILKEFDNTDELEKKKVELAHKYEEMGVKSARELIKQRLAEIQ